MLTDLEWMESGRPFPPPCEAERLRNYDENEKLFDGRHAQVFGEGYMRIERYLKKRHISPAALLNYAQLLTKKTADFVCGAPPLVESAVMEDRLNALLSAAGFSTLLYEAVMDISRFGDAPVKLVEGRLSLVSADCWFPIVDSTDVKRITHHVIIYPASRSAEGGCGGLYAEIHGRGSVEVREYAAAKAPGGGIQFGSLKSRSEYQTGLEDFAVKVLRNVSHSKTVFGVDDYNIIKPLLERLMWRLHCIDTVLDKHSEPSLSGPAGALSFDEKTGMHYLDLGNYFKRSRADEPGVEYLTWDGNLESSFKEVDTLLNQIYLLSEMGAAFMDAQGGALSAAALKLRMTSPRVKARRIAGINTETVKQLIAMLAGANGIAVHAEDVSLTFNDGLPVDPAEEAAMLMAANGGLPVESQLSAIKRWNGVSDERAAQVQRQILRER